MPPAHALTIVISAITLTSSFGCADEQSSRSPSSPAPSASSAAPPTAAGTTAPSTAAVSSSPSAPASSEPAPAITRPAAPLAGAAAEQTRAGAPAASGSSGQGSAGVVAAANGGQGGAPASEPGASAPAGDALIRGDDPTDSTGTQQGPFKVAKYTSGFADKPGFLAATIYYPEDAQPPFAHVVFCPGFVSYQTSIQDWGPFLASYGIVIMTIDTNSSSDSVTVRQTALKDALTSLQAENERSDSPLKGKLHMSRFGLMGWSMGGGASLLNGAMHPEYKSIVTVAEHLATAPGMDEPLKSLTVPALMFAGTSDTAILGLNMSQPAYETIPDTTTKMLYEVKGADHFFFNTPHALDGVVGRYALAWQKVFLEGDERYRKLLTDKGPMASDFRTNFKP